MASRDQYLSIQELEQIAHESGSEMDNSDLDDKFVYEIDDDDSDVDVSTRSIVANVQGEQCVRFINSILLSGL